MKLPTLLAACLLAASTVTFAQAPQGDAAKAPREERRAKVKAAHEKAAKACEAAKGAEHRACMRKEMCAQSADPAKCEAKAKERQANRDKK